MSWEVTPRMQAAGLTLHAMGLGPIGTNCYVLHRDGDTRAVVVDPGAEVERVLALVEREGLTVEGVLVTHSHWDHVGAVADLADATGAPVWMSAIEAPVASDIASYAPAQFGPWRNWTVDHELDDHDRFTVAGIDFEVLLLPGHSPGSLGYLVAPPEGTLQPPLLVIGDVIFQDSVGRTDLPFGDPATLLDSCRRVLGHCTDDTLLVPGHGPETTVGRERTHNPFLLQALAAR
jgi:glyoxylase-like metal-dependent hydrolase (beta-lactamase superfamily II)